MTKKSEINPLDILAALGDLSAASKPAPKAKGKSAKAPADSSGELVDVVDEKDNVIGKATRAEAYEKGLRHRLIVIILETKDGDILVQWRSRHKKTSPRLFSFSVVGTVSAGDSYDETAVRELREELGLTDQPLQKIGMVYKGGDSPRNMCLYALQYDGEIEGWEEEADAIDYWNQEEAEFMLARFPYLLTESFDVLMKKYLTWRKKHER